LVEDGERQRSQPGLRKGKLAHARAALDGEFPHVLVAGDDASTRSKMLDELRDLLPESTHYLEAHETWEMLARAAGSRMVVLTGDLGEVSIRSLIRLLGRRHPTLPVLAVHDRTRASGPNVDAARP
jgi:hypothetical protein